MGQTFSIPGSLANEAKYDGDDESRRGNVLWKGHEFPVERKKMRWNVVKKFEQEFNDLLQDFKQQ